MQPDRSTRSRDGTPPSRGRAGEQSEALLDALARLNPLRQVVRGRRRPGNRRRRPGRSPRRPGSCGRRFQPAGADAGRSRCGPGTPTATGSPTTTAPGCSTRCSAQVSRPWCWCPPTRSSTRGSGRPKSRTCRAITGWSPSTAVATGAPTGRWPQRPTPRRRTSPSWRRCWTPPARTRWCWSGCATTASGGRCASPPTTPSGSPASSPSRSGCR